MSKPKQVNTPVNIPMIQMWIKALVSRKYKRGMYSDKSLIINENLDTGEKKIEARYCALGIWAEITGCKWKKNPEKSYKNEYEHSSGDMCRYTEDEYYAYDKRYMRNLKSYAKLTGLSLEVILEIQDMNDRSIPFYKIARRLRRIVNNLKKKQTIKLRYSPAEKYTSSKAKKAKKAKKTKKDCKQSK